jgi:hypothetical protein
LPAHLTVAFLENSDPSKLPDAVGAVSSDLEVKVASVEQRP